MKKIRVKSKRGVILQSSTIRWILLILVAVVMLIATGVVLYSVLVVGPRACHYSIVFRSTFSYGALNFLKDVIPIKCQETRTCFTIGGECSMYGDAKRVKKIDVSGTDEEIKKKIYAELANIHYEANWAVGEGKLDFLPSNFGGPDVADFVHSRVNQLKDWADKGPLKFDSNADFFPSIYYCIIYGTFDFDDELKKKAEGGFKLNWIEFYRFLQDNTAPNNKETGLHYLYGINNIASVQELISQSDKALEEKDQIKTFDWDISGVDLKDGKGKQKVQYAILIKTTKGNVWETFLSKPETYASIGAYVLSFVKFGKIGVPGASLIRKGATVYGAVQFTKAIGETETEYSPPSIIVNKAEAYKRSMCAEFPFSP